MNMSPAGKNDGRPLYVLYVPRPPREWRFYFFFGKIPPSGNVSEPDFDNSIEVRLLREDPRALLLKYQDMLRIIVRRYVSSGMFRGADIDDILQELNAALLERLPRIQRQYDGSSLVRTYFSAIVRNLCRDMRRDAREKNAELPLEPENVPDSRNPMARYEVEHAIRKFRAVLRQYSAWRHYPKLLLGLKLRYRLPLSAADILLWYPGCSDSDVNRLLAIFEIENPELQDWQIWDEVTAVSNKAEGKTNTPDAFRKWIEDQIGEILALMNWPGGTSSFDDASLKILIEDFFSPFLRREG